jgi:hypothetical protein
MDEYDVQEQEYQDRQDWIAEEFEKRYGGQDED